MKNKLFLYQCIRSREVRLALLLISLLGIVAILIGNQHLTQQQAAINEVEAHQKEHLERHVALHNDDIGLLLYYVKFAFIKPSNSLAGLSIGQSDVNPSINRITIKTFEGQKHDTDLINPMSLQSGNLDFSFVLIYLIPLLVIVLSFNVISEETETGTWRLVAVQAKSKLQFVIAKLLVRFALLMGVIILLFAIAILVLDIPLNTNLLVMFLLTLLYIVFWFSLSFFVIVFKKSSGFNALMLLSIWLGMLIVLPAGINAYLAAKYPVPEALSSAIAQRDGYHTKWDTDKLPTIKKFYTHYPQFEKYGYPTEGFNWLWYYAMQQMGDDDSQKERESLSTKIALREQASRGMAAWVPNMHMQLALNRLAGTSSGQHIAFLNATEAFHEKLRLFFYPSIFESQKAESIDWEQMTPEYYKPDQEVLPMQSLLPLLLAIGLILVAAVPKSRKL
ncbi:DUF3526 domain-containing protein [Spongiimicrobium salis]|uniref:DUF3526 domain-containing protein n=1 Tax=Spongiimicrobium salis TaxID=1667022 RepID=UPI00374D5C01